MSKIESRVSDARCKTKYKHSFMIGYIGHRTTDIKPLRNTL